MRLYYSPGACSLAPHVMLREIGQPFQLMEVNTARGDHRTEAYLEINPRGRVPALEAGGITFTETPAILVFLALRYPEHRLLPDPGSPDLPRCLEWLAWFSSGLHVAFLQLWRPERHLPPGADSAELAAHARASIAAMICEIEQRLVGPWLVGEQFSIADIYALVFFGWAGRIGLDIAAECPRWTLWAGAMLGRESVRESLSHEGIAGWFAAAAPQT